LALTTLNLNGRIIGAKAAGLDGERRETERPPRWPQGASKSSLRGRAVTFYNSAWQCQWMVRPDFNYPLTRTRNKICHDIVMGDSLFPWAPPPKATSISKATRNSPKSVVLWSTQDFRFLRKTPHLRVNEYTL